MASDHSKLTPGIFPTAEDDQIEFKSSLTSDSQIKDKLPEAVSAFANSGGGTFILGVDGAGNADGGISEAVGRQSRRDWLDNLINQVKSTPKYEIKEYVDCEGRGLLDADKMIVAVVIPESHTAPHMAPDGKYYMRAGASTQRAPHFIVEALWAARSYSKPMLSHTLRVIPSGTNDIIQLGILALTDAPATNVHVNLAPLPGLLKGNEASFPLKIPVIDRLTPFFMDLTIDFNEKDMLPEATELTVTYSDVAGNKYVYRNDTPLVAALPPLRFRKDPFAPVTRALEEIARKPGARIASF
jgi:hypothetical protein